MKRLKREAEAAEEARKAEVARLQKEERQRTAAGRRRKDTETR